MGLYDEMDEYVASYSRANKEKERGKDRERDRDRDRDRDRRDRRDRDRDRDRWEKLIQSLREAEREAYSILVPEYICPLGQPFLLFLVIVCWY